MAKLSHSNPDLADCLEPPLAINLPRLSEDQGKALGHSSQVSPSASAVRGTTASHPAAIERARAEFYAAWDAVVDGRHSATSAAMWAKAEALEALEMDQ